MKILILYSGVYSTNEKSLKGIFQTHQARAMKDNNIEVDILAFGLKPVRQTFSQDNEFKHVIYKGIDVYNVYSNKYLPNRLYPVKLLVNRYRKIGLKAFKEYIKNNGMPDYIHAHNCFHAGVTAELINREYNIPYILTEHSSAFVRYGISKKMHDIAQNIYNKSHVNIAVSEAFKNHLEQQFNAEWNCVPNVLDPDFANIEIKRGKRDNFTFLSIGSLDSNKNHISLIKAFANKFKDSNVTLKIGGTGKLLKTLKEKTVELNIENQVDFLGHLDRGRVKEEMQRSDVFVLPSKYETFGVVLIEALACGKPIISTMCGGAEDIVDDDNGVLVPVDDIESLGDAMVHISENIESYNPASIKKKCIQKFGSYAFVNSLLGLINYNEQRISN